MEEDIVIGRNDKLEDIAQLATTERYQSIMAQVGAALEAEDAAEGSSVQGPLLRTEDDPTYK